MSPDRSPRRAPDEPPRLLPGRPAMIWLRSSGFSLLATLACIVLFWVELNVLPAGALRDNIAYALLCAIAVLAVVFGILYFKSLWAGRRERRAGYTTTYDKNDRDLWLLDWRTGEVRYRPGEPRTTRRSDRA